MPFSFLVDFRSLERILQQTLLAPPPLPPLPGRSRFCPHPLPWRPLSRYRGPRSFRQAWIATARSESVNHVEGGHYITWGRCNLCFRSSPQLPVVHEKLEHL